MTGRSAAIRCARYGVDMAERIVRHRRRDQREDADPGSAGAEAVAGTGDKLKADLDDLLDEIDDVLETNAEEFVKSYVQKGGQ